jgi:hypothetical protein
MATFFDPKLLGKNQKRKKKEWMTMKPKEKKWGGNKHPPPKYKTGPTLDI